MQHYLNIGKRKMTIKKNNSDDKNLDNSSLEKRLDTIISLLLESQDNDDTQLKKIEYLTRMSFANDEIAKILGTTKGTIEAQKYKKPKTKKSV